MTKIWYYAEGDKAVGPISLSDLVTILSHVSKAESVLVWRDGLPNWVEAKNLPEVAPHVIKPPPLHFIRRAVTVTNEHRNAPEQNEFMQEPTWHRAISVWWLISWRGLIGGVIIGVIVGLVVRLIGSLAGVNDEAIEFTSTVVGTLLGYVWVIIVLVLKQRSWSRLGNARSATAARSPHFRRLGAYSSVPPRLFLPHAFE